MLFLINPGVVLSDTKFQPTTEPSIIDSNCKIEPGCCNPENKVCEFVFEPVCGCDHKTYENKCVCRYFGCNKRWSEGAC